MKQLIILAMTSPLWGGFIYLAWQVRKFLRVLVETKTGKEEDQLAKKDNAKEIADEAVELLAQLAAETGRDKIWDRAIDLKARLNRKGESNER